MTASRTELASVWPPTAAIAEKAGHTRKSPMKAIREKCLDCCCGQISEVRACESVKCSLWPFRAGQHPYTSSKLENPLHGADYQENGPVSAATDPSQVQSHVLQGN